ncbi:hypothetical protein C8Q73DRAFT_667173 [Cubamyces lactineus]|nr:hypothetical protein C8Q73DRAFT_667173 [Cubamyces lactineus]
MKYLTALVSLGAATTGVIAQCTVRTPIPPPSHCQTVALTWTGCVHPVTLEVRQFLDGPIVDGPFTVNSDVFIWTARPAAGSEVNLLVTDAIGDTSTSAPFSIAPSVLMPMRFGPMRLSCFKLWAEDEAVLKSDFSPVFSR